MKKYVILAVTLALTLSAFASCSSSKNDSEPTSGDIASVLENESVSGDYSNVRIDSRVPMKAGECEIYLDADHNSEKKDGDSVLYYSDSDLVMKKTYSAGKLISKSIYNNYEIKFTYTYDSNNALTEVSASGEAGDGSPGESGESGEPGEVGEVGEAGEVGEGATETPSELGGGSAAAVVTVVTVVRERRIRRGGRAGRPAP